MTVSTVMVAISELAKPLAWRPCSDKFNLAQSSTITLYKLAPSLAQEICDNRGLSRKVVIIDCDRLFPRVVGLRDMESERSKPDSDSAEAGTELNRHP